MPRKEASPAPLALPPDGSFATKQKVAQKRVAIAAEALNNAAEVDVSSIPKTDDTRALIGERR